MIQNENLQKHIYELLSPDWKIHEIANHSGPLLEKCFHIATVVKTLDTHSAGEFFSAIAEAIRETEVFKIAGRAHEKELEVAKVNEQELRAQIHRLQKYKEKFDLDYLLKHGKEFKPTR